MEIRQIANDYAVSPQIHPEDAARIKEAGFVAVICNRPDGEIPPELRADTVRAAVEAAGLRFIDNPVLPGQLTAKNVALQGETLAQADGPVFAYCASGNRSTIVWALSQAGRRPTGEMIADAARWGYNLEVWRAQIDALAARQG